MEIKYSTVVRAYLAMQRNKPIPNSGVTKFIRNTIEVATGQLKGQKPTLIQTTSALLCAGYTITGAPNEAEYYLKESNNG